MIEGLCFCYTTNLKLSIHQELQGSGIFAPSHCRHWQMGWNSCLALQQYWLWHLFHFVKTNRFHTSSTTAKFTPVRSCSTCSHVQKVEKKKKISSFISIPRPPSKASGHVALACGTSTRTNLCKQKRILFANISWLTDIMKNVLGKNCPLTIQIVWKASKTVPRRFIAAFNICHISKH